MQPSQGFPRIGIPVRLSSSEGADPRVGKANGLFESIVELLRRAGAETVLLDSAGDSAGDVRGLDGVLLPGGGDLNPGLYGEEPGTALYDVNTAQDELDIVVGKAGITAGIPVLGICRGHQLLNVLYGGTLIQDMHPSEVLHRLATSADPAADAQDGRAEDSWAWHDVGLTAGSRLAALYGGSRSVRIASGHHQAVARVGYGLVVTAVADDGTIEGLEDPRRWVVSMQWHPETGQLPDEQRLAPFQAFVDVCRDPAGGS
ncbi:gamma-glutamyl-gamma-aminobutyrate hydrolase family protein [Arthrobacter silvisoli]|uniref:gamma-glutamyl-gamma-aminobutyrate hydrolase family protein n=1 Tax=Arthrobacter silvisoli TaxID=2291022 RepID=UPI000E21728A|nr:type 1 glutamine amidotransferase [Arthrobacter silvisoli]